MYICYSISYIVYKKLSNHLRGMNDDKSSEFNFDISVALKIVIPVFHLQLNRFFLKDPK